MLSVSKGSKNFSDNSKKALELISKYGHKLEPHPLYKLYKIKPTQSDLSSSSIIKSKKNPDEKNSKIIKIIDRIVRDSGAELVLTNDETSNEFDCLHILATGGLSIQLVKINFTDMGESDFRNMNSSTIYAKQVYDKARKALVNSGRFQMNNQSDIKIIAFECEPTLTAIVSAANLFPNDSSKFKDVSGVEITTCPAVDYLKLNPNQFDSRYNFSWDEDWSPKCEGRGGLDYYFPIGWEGFALKVLGKYDNGNDDWINKRNESGWAVGYHGVSNNPEEKIPSILGDKLNPGSGQLYEYSKDCNPLLSEEEKDRYVGKGVYLAQKVEDSENIYSEPIEIEGKYYKVLFQCRMKPQEIRMPKGRPDYYVIPDGDFIRPYRILVKEVNV